METCGMRAKGGQCLKKREDKNGDAEKRKAVCSWSGRRVTYPGRSLLSLCIWSTFQDQGTMGI